MSLLLKVLRCLTSRLWRGCKELSKIAESLVSDLSSTTTSKLKSGMAAFEPSSGHGEGTTGESSIPIVSDVQESVSIELDPSTSTPVTKEEERATFLPVQPPQTKATLLEGTLARKHEMEGTNKKAANRSWNNIYCVLKPGQLSAYKDVKSFAHGVTYHGEDPLSLSNAICEVPTNYKKKKLVFKLRLEDGSEYLFQCRDEEELQIWTRSIEKAAQQVVEEPASGSSEPQAQPSSSTNLETLSAKKDKEKRFSLFTKKK